MTDCPFKYLFGRPRTGIHSTRIPILDWALADTAMTVVLAWLLARWLMKPFWFVFLLTFLVGEISHLLTCVDTAFTRRMTDILAPSGTVAGARS